jgi:putative transport protein
MHFSDLASTVVVIALVSFFGLILGKIKIKSFSLGIGGVLFAGIIVAWSFKNYLGVDLNEGSYFPQTLHFVQEFGLILFVYAIGNQVGPAFFASFKSSGVKLLGLATLIVVLGCSVAFGFHKIGNLPLADTLGVYSGAVTNTPALGASQSMLRDITVPQITHGKRFDLFDEELSGVCGKAAGDMSCLSSDKADEYRNKANKMIEGRITSGYAVAYPFGILGIFLTIVLMKIIFKISIPDEGRKFDEAKTKLRKSISAVNVELTNEKLFGKKLLEIPELADSRVICSRIKRAGELHVPHAEMPVEKGDILHLVGEESLVKAAAPNIGQEVQVSMSTKGTNMRSVRVVVTHEKVLGKSIADMQLKEKYEVVVSRLVRTGVELIPDDHQVLQFGDVLNIVGNSADIDAVAKLLGDSKQKMMQVNMMPVFIGIFLGVIVGCIEIPIPGMTASLKLGLAGGPLVVALVLARYGSSITMGRMSWFIPISANNAVRELGIVLFLSCVGIVAGGKFTETVATKAGLMMMLYGACITFIPLFITGLIAIGVMKLNYLSVSGMFAGSCTDPPALAFANSLHTNSEATSLGYATVYPLTMFLRILSPQLIVILALMVD